MQKKEVRNIDLDIQEKFKIINDYLPRHYTKLVQAKVADASLDNIRRVKHDKQGDPIIIKALYEVALETKELLEPANN